jgi:AraC-like DNA-binding protein
VEYRERLPHPALRPFVRACWTLVGGGAETAPQPILPDGCTELVVHRQRPFRRFAAGVVERQAPLLFAGQMRRPVLLAPDGAAEALGIRFHPHGAYALLGLPQQELVDEIPPADALGLPWLAAALRRAREAATLPCALGLVEQALLRRLERRRAVRDGRVDAVVGLVERSRGAVGVEAAAAFAGTSRRHLERLFREWVGVGPKVLARLARFQAAAARVTREPAVPLSAVSADSGYFDQAHMIREFQALGGASPDQMRRGLSRMTAAMMNGRDE